MSFEKSMSLDPELPEAYIAKGRYFYYAFRDYPEALAAYERAAELRANDWFVIHNIGIINKRQGSFEEALEWFSRARILNPASRWPQLEEVNVHIITRNYGKAEELIRKILPLWPNDYNIYQKLIRIYGLSDDNTDRMRQVLETIPSGVDPERTESLWINTYILEGKYEEALEVLAGQSERDFLTEADLYNYLGRDEDMKARADSARVELEDKTSRDPGESWWHVRLGRAYALLDRREDAIREGERGVALMPVSKDALYGVTARRELAQIYVLVGEHDAAVVEIEGLLEIPSYLTKQVLRKHPIYAPLKENPRFVELIASNP
jgi:tetratricopeptide (TPR) repeat protein